MPEGVSQSPIICFGQQPCGFFPKRFLVAKIWTARRLQQEIGGEIVFFYHDSDHDPRETRTIVRHRQSGNPILLNFEFENKWQRKFSPLYLKRVAAEWSRKMGGQLGNYVGKKWVEAFRAVAARSDVGNVADFCLEMYRAMGLMDGIRVVRSSDAGFRRAACEISDFFVDVPYEGEVVRARYGEGKFLLHEGGDVYVTVPAAAFGKEQVSPTRDSRLAWMQSVIRCTHYVSGAGEQAYLKKEEAPEITFVTRDAIERSDEAYTDLPE
jgi:hypothetical protein